MPDQVRHDGVRSHADSRAGSHYLFRHTGPRAGSRCAPLVIPASEPVSMVVAVAWFSGLWMPDQVRHDGVWSRTGPRAGIHGGGSGVVSWSMDAGSSPA
ncbi:hypothetical protein [Zhongshania sp.]|uniref:hypothetical protein n=1 Tax=Zhongshania sp. TaxID=1971902 RepID=UPI002A806A16|nr:hypothetical protein [Zhongshania sp.]